MLLLHLTSIALLSLTPSPLGLVANARACDLAERRDALFRRASITEQSGTVMSVLPRLFARNGFLLVPGPLTARGPESVARVLERDSLNATSRLRALTIGGDVSSDGDDGFTYGYFDTFRANGDSLLGWYHAYWRRDADGEWRVLAMTRRRRPPGAMSQPLTPEKATKSPCAEPTRALDSVAVLKEIMAADLAFSDSAASSVAAAFGAFAAEDAAKSGTESAFVYGKQAIMRLFEPPPPAGLKWGPELGSSARGGNFGFTVGWASPRVIDANAPPRDPATAGHYFTIWRRDADGRWRYVID